MKILKWLIDNEPAVAAGVAAAATVFYESYQASGWSWWNLLTVIPLALAAGVRAVVSPTGKQ